MVLSLGEFFDKVHAATGNDDEDEEGGKCEEVLRWDDAKREHNNNHNNNNDNDKGKDNPKLPGQPTGEGKNGSNHKKRKRIQLFELSRHPTRKSRCIRLLHFFCLRLDPGYKKEKEEGENDDDRENDDFYNGAVPCVSDLDENDVARTVPEVNLRCSSITLENAKFVRCWNFHRVEKVQDYEAALKPFHGDDGPLMALYSECNVVQVEIKDVGGYDIMLFCYGDWADKVYRVLEPIVNGGKNALFSLTNIPAKCVLPYDAARVNHGDHPFCVVLGSACKSLKFDNIKESFETESMLVKIVSERNQYTLTTKSSTAAPLNFIPNEHQVLEEDEDEVTHKSTERKKQAVARESQVDVIDDVNGILPDKDDARPNLKHAHNLKKELSLMRKRKNNTYQYTALSELKYIVESQNNGHPKQYINIYGIIREFNRPYLTRAGDFLYKLAIEDETCQDKIQMCIFLKPRGNVPEVSQAGDIIRGHRIGVSAYGGSVNLTGYSTRSSFVVIRPKQNQCFDFDEAIDEDKWIIRSTSATYTFDFNDKFISKSLWKIGQSLISSTLTGDAIHAKTIAEVQAREDEFIDIIGLVTLLLPATQENGPKGFIRLWDGTGPPVTDSYPVDVSSNALLYGDPTPEALDAVLNGVSTFEDANLSTPQCLCGRVLNVVVWEDAHWNFITDGNVVSPGCWVRLRNVGVRTSTTGQKELKLIAKSWITPLPSSAIEVKQLLQKHDERIKRNDTPNIKSAIYSNDIGRITSPSFAKLKIMHTSWHHSLHIFQNSGTNEFVLRGNILGVIPEVDVSDSESLFKCLKNNSAGKINFSFALKIRDDCNDIEAIVPNSVAEKILNTNATEASMRDSYEVRKNCMSTFSTLVDQSRNYEIRLRCWEIRRESFIFLEGIKSVTI